MPESLTSGLPRVPSLRQGPGKFLSGRSFTVSGKKAATQTANRYGMETFGYNLLGVTPPSVAVGMRQGDFGGVGIPGDLSLQTQGMQGETQPRSCWMPTATNQAALLNHIQDPFQDSTLALPQVQFM